MDTLRRLRIVRDGSNNSISEGDGEELINEQEIEESKTIQEEKETSANTIGDDETESSTGIEKGTTEHSNSSEEEEEGEDKARGEMLEEYDEKIYLKYWSFTPGIIRRLLDKIVSSTFFKSFIIITIIINLIILAARDPLDQDNKSKRNQILADLDFACLIIFTVEMILKIIVFGVVFHKGSYFRDGWNWLDFGIVLVGWISYVRPESRALLAIRSLRVLKPLRTITLFPSMMRFILCAYHSLSFIACVAILISILFIFFSLFGVILFNGVLRNHCFVDTPTSSSTPSTSSSKLSSFPSSLPLSSSFYSSGTSSFLPSLRTSHYSSPTLLSHLSGIPIP